MDTITAKYIKIDTDIRQLLIKVRGIVGYQLYLGNGKTWRIDKQAQESSKSVNIENLKN